MSNDKKAIETNWGKLIISGATFTQEHYDLINCILEVKSDIKEFGGDLDVCFHKTDVLNKHNGDLSKNSEWLDSKLEDIRRSRIELYHNDGAYYSFLIANSLMFLEDEETVRIAFNEKYFKMRNDLKNLINLYK